MGAIQVLREGPLLSRSKTALGYLADEGSGGLGDGIAEIGVLAGEGRSPFPEAENVIDD